MSKESIQEFLGDHLEPNFGALCEKLSELETACKTAREKLLAENEEINITKVMEDVHFKYSEMCSHDWTVDTILHLLTDTETIK